MVEHYKRRCRSENLGVSIARACEATTVTYTEKEQRLFEQRSLENLIWLYREELLQIVEGDNDISLLPRTVRRRLRGCGVLTKSRHKYDVTPKGKKMLSKEAS